MARMKRGKFNKKSKGKVSKGVKKYVKKTLDNLVEDKYLDLSQTIAPATAATDNAGSVVLLSGMSQGLTFATRIGEVIRPKSFQWKIDTAPIDIAFGVATRPNDTNLRVIIFQDNQIRTSTLPTVADVLETVAYNSPLNHVFINARRFKILLDKVFEMDPLYVPNGTATQAVAPFYTNQTWQRASGKRKLSGKIVYTNASTGTERGNIYVLYLSDQATAAAPSINMYSRLVFEDS